MGFFRPGYRPRHTATCFLLVMVLLRAYVPTGYMPLYGSPLHLQVCPTGMPAHSMEPAPDTHPAGGAAHVSDCPFGHSPVAGPIADGVAFSCAQAALSEPVLAFDTRPAGVRLLRAHQARAPPTPA
jgi:hypothetical protein